ncbi:MAG: hypothetical protein J6T98_05245 [Salinivirgaceae bacterium]|nr:hypothetical protein [Salinivirgaceae bacterium]
MQKRYNPIRLKLSKMIVGEHDAPNRLAVPCTLEKAARVGLMFAVSSDADLADANYVYSQLSTFKAGVSVLGYVLNGKELLAYQQQSHFNLVTDADFDFLYRPKNAMVADFAATPFDILIDINSAQFYPTRLLLHRTAAKFRIGRFADNQPFDLMLSIDGTKDTKYYFEQIQFYLKKFN